MDLEARSKGVLHQDLSRTVMRTVIDKNQFLFYFQLQRVQLFEKCSQVSGFVVDRDNETDFFSLIHAYFLKYEEKIWLRAKILAVVLS
jgi:hypothetical protein